MKDLLDFIVQNRTWIPPSVLFVIVGVVLAWFLLKSKSNEKPPVLVNVNQSVNNTASTSSKDENLSGGDAFDEALGPASTLKSQVRVLFIDDSRTYKIATILKNAGWENVELIGDPAGVEIPKIEGANIIFVDIKGVGRKLNLSDEGLGLAKAIKTRFPKKKVVLYSATLLHDPFNSAFKLADETIRKNAESYEFEELIIRLCK